MVDVPAATPGRQAGGVDRGHAGVADAQVTWLVKSCVELSENVPVAVNCWVSPLGDARIRPASPRSTAGSSQCGDRQRRRARHPAQRSGDRRRSRRHAGRQTGGVDASPPEVLPDDQATWFVRFCVELSEKVPVAVNCWVAPLAMLGLAGVTAIDRRVTAAALTVSTVEPVTPFSVARDGRRARRHPGRQTARR